jgi:hypothetical protein
MTQSNPLFAAVNDECSFEEYECGTRVIAFDTEEDATRWVSHQEDFADWIIVPLEHMIKVSDIVNVKVEPSAAPFTQGPFNPKMILGEEQP